MKNLWITLFIIIVNQLNAQNRFNYQSLIKDANGAVLTNTQISLKFSILYDSSSGTPVYVETHGLTTPANGVVNLVIGSGTATTGSFSNIDWSKASIYLKREVDIANSGTYTDFGSSLLNSVPKSNYSLATQGISFGSNTVSVTNLMVTNTVTATKFVGDGSGLTGISSSVNSSTHLDSNYSIAIGGVVSATNSVAVGYQALSSNTTGSYNTAHGYTAGFTNTSGNYNTFIGSNADVASNNLTNVTALGANAIVTTNNTIQLGDENVTLVQTSGTISATTINSSNEININSSLPSIDLKNTSDSEQNQIRFIGRGRVLTRIDNSSNNVLNPTGARFRIVSYQPIQLSARADPGMDRASNTNFVFGYFKLDDRSASIEINGGTFTIDGYATSSGFSTASDIRIKKNIKDLDYGLDDLVKMRPVKYNLVSNNNIEIGLIAQDVKKIIPELVKGKEGLIENGEVLSINYNGFAPIIIKALQEQNNTIELQKDKIEKMEQEILVLKAAIEKLITE